MSCVERNGFTLVETLATIVIFSFILSAIFAVFYVADMSWNADAGTLELQQQARQAMYRMVEEIRQGSASDITIGNGGSNITFKIPSAIAAGSVTYSGLISYSLNSYNQIIREHPSGTRKIVATDINSLSFCCWHGSTCDADCSGSSILQIQLNATKTVRQKAYSFPLLEKVWFRNKRTS